MPRSIDDSGIVEQPPSFLKRWILRPVVVVLDRVWDVLAFILGAVIIGGILVNVLISLITTGTPGVADPRTWVIIRSLLVQPVYSAIGLGIFLILVLSSYLCHRVIKRDDDSKPLISDKELKEIYGLAPAASAVPSNALIPSFNPHVYIPRRTTDKHESADDRARVALLNAMTRSDLTSHETSYGFCVYGRKLLGTSRLAWQTLKHDVNGIRGHGRWTLVRWPLEPRRHSDLIRALANRHAQVIVWLENLPDLAATKQYQLINSLPLDLADSKIPFVVIATCHDGFSEKAARKAFGDLMKNLTPIPLADISRDEAGHLMDELGIAGDGDHRRDEYDGTPGSIVLGVTRMRYDVYPNLPELAQYMLRAIKLLRSAGIRDYPIKRVNAVVRDVFNASGSATELDHAILALKDADFVTVQVVNSILTMTNDVYLDLAVPPDTGAHSHAADEWSRLKASFEQEEDWQALARLGDAFRRRGDVQQAEISYRSALRGLRKDTASDDWALAQFGLGSLLLEQIDTSAEGQRALLLNEAKRALESALSVVTAESDPIIWAEASNGLATVFRTEAATGLDALLRQGGPTTRQKKIRGQALESALIKSRDALKELKKETAPDEWAEAEYQLGLVHYVTAQLSGEPRDRRTKLDIAIEAHQRALTVFTESENPTKVARTERALGDACKLRADVSIRPRKDEMLQLAIGAYNHAIGISTARHLWSGDELGSIQSNLASCLRSLALLSEEPRRSELLESAADAWRAASHNFDPEASTTFRAEALRDLGGVLLTLASLSESQRQSELANESLVVFTDAFKTLGGRGTRSLRAQLHLGLASVHWQRATSTTPSPTMDVVQAFGNAERALHTFPPDEHTAELNQARKIARDAERKAKELNISLPTQGDSSSGRNQREVS